MNGPNLPPVAASNVVIRASPLSLHDYLASLPYFRSGNVVHVGSCVLECVCVCGEGAGEYCGPSQKPKREPYPLKLVNRSNLQKIPLKYLQDILV